MFYYSIILMLCINVSFSSCALGTSRQLLQEWRKNYTRHKSKASSASLVEGSQQAINHTVQETASDLYKRINNTWTELTPKNNMQVESTFWMPQWYDKVEERRGIFQHIKSPTLIYRGSPEVINEALDDLIAKPAVVEQGIALATVKIFCLRKILGLDAFKEYVIHFYKTIQTTPKWEETFFHQVSSMFIQQQSGEPIVGTIAYITNVLHYSSFKPNGVDRGYYLFCTYPNHYIGFGRFYKKGPQSLDAIEALYLELFSKTDDVERDPAQHRSTRNIFESKNIVFRDTRRSTQREHYKFHLIYDQKVIEEYKKTKKMKL